MWRNMDITVNSNTNLDTGKGLQKARDENEPILLPERLLVYHKMANMVIVMTVSEHGVTCPATCTGKLAPSIV